MCTFLIMFFRSIFCSDRKENCCRARAYQQIIQLYMQTKQINLAKVSVHTLNLSFLPCVSHVFNVFCCYFFIILRHKKGMRMYNIHQKSTDTTDTNFKTLAMKKRRVSKVILNFKFD